MFLRPTRWGKSEFLRTLTIYYNKAKKESFNDTFGDLYVGRHPTSSRNSLLVLHFDFSVVPVGIGDNFMKDCFNGMINIELKRFLRNYQEFLGGHHQELVDENSGQTSLRQVFVGRTIFFVCVLIV